MCLSELYYYLNLVATSSELSRAEIISISVQLSAVAVPVPLCVPLERSISILSALIESAVYYRRRSCLPLGPLGAKIAPSTARTLETALGQTIPTSRSAHNGNKVCKSSLLYRKRFLSAPIPAPSLQNSAGLHLSVCRAIDYLSVCPSVRLCVCVCLSVGAPVYISCQSLASRRRLIGLPISMVRARDVAESSQSRRASTVNYA